MALLSKFSHCLYVQSCSCRMIGALSVVRATLYFFFSSANDHLCKSQLVFFLLGCFYNISDVQRAGGKSNPVQNELCSLQP